jgi:predicted membrane-bound spermidine synthase
MSQERSLSGALFLVALATLMFEVLLTRVFSLTLWYHFAFMAISLAMFGMTLGALLVFLRPQAWPEATLRRSMGRCALLFAATMAAVILLHSVTFVPSPRIALWPIAVTFAAAALPFVFSGIFVCLALTRFPARIGQLYAFDLAGAALGCLAVIAALELLDGVGAVIACATLAALAGALLLRGSEQVLGALVAAVLAATTAWAAIHLARHDLALFPVQYVKGTERYEIDYERWNSFSRIAVMKPTGWDVPAWSVSSAFAGSLKIPNRALQIDAGAGTALIAFDGDLSKLEFLRWDLVNFVHHLRRDARICVVGSGGGRDILAAKVFGQKQIVAVEINADILNVVNGRFGDYTGHLDRDPIVRLVNDEARSYLARSKERFDIVQVTFIDTWAATAAGAYTLTENSLYTVEGWKTFLDRVEDNGLLAVSRGVGPELARLVALGRAALLASGASNPEQHMVLVTNRHGKREGSFGAMGMLLVRKTPFPPEELAIVRRAAEQLRFDVDLEPGAARTGLLRVLATGQGADPELSQGRVDYSAPTDDQPFFFNLHRLGTWTLGRQHLLHQEPALLVVDLLMGVSLLALLCIALPFAFAKTAFSRGDFPLLAFFAAIGAGFMLIEIAMLQRLIIFLGHPIYSLSVILFVLLLAGGIGARLSARVAAEELRTKGIALLGSLTAVVAVAGVVIAPLTALFQSAQTPLRIAVSAGLLAVMGIFMGAAFPLGMRLASSVRAELTPWFWAVNGATSVVASVLAVVVAMAWGISTSFWAGVASYLLAAAAFAFAARRLAR